MFRFAVAAAVVVLGISFGIAPAKADLITNGGFESGDFTGWNLNATFTSVLATGFIGNAHSGLFFAGLGDSSPTFGSLDQAVLDTPGDVLTLSYWLASDGLLPNYFQAFWNGNPLSGSALNNSGAFPYTQFQFVVNATGADTLIFLQRNPQSYFFLDDVSLVSGGPGNPDPQPSPVPEPSAMLLVASGLAFLVARKRKQGAP